MNINKKYYAAGVFFTLLLVGTMTFVTELSGENELFFPEILAVAIGCFIMPRRPWHAKGWQIILCLTFSAWLGIGLVICGGMPLWAQMTTGYIISAVILTIFKSNFVPMLSAVLLPIMLQSSSPIYPLAVTCLAVLTLTMEQILIRLGWREKYEDVPIEDDIKQRLLSWARLSAVLAGLLAIMLSWGGFYCVPPLIVAYTVFADQDRPIRKHMIIGYLQIILAAIMGALGQEYLVHIFVHAPQIAPVVSIILLVLIFLLICRKMRWILPPAGAILLFAFLLPSEEILYYIPNVAAGGAIFLAGGRVFSLGHVAIRRFCGKFIH